jgi:hypothetical protein
MMLAEVPEAAAQQTSLLKAQRRAMGNSFFDVG